MHYIMRVNCAVSVGQHYDAIIKTFHPFTSWKRLQRHCCVEKRRNFSHWTNTQTSHQTQLLDSKYNQIFKNSTSSALFCNSNRSISSSGSIVLSNCSQRNVCDNAHQVLPMGKKCSPLLCVEYFSWRTQQHRHYTNRNILKLHERGIWKERFPETDMEFERSMATTRQSMYAGFDPTADALHVGNLLVLMALLHCQRAGHRPIVLLGDFTSSIGDPSGRNSQRPDQLSPSETSNNLAKIQDAVTNIFRTHQTLIWQEDKQPLQPLLVVNNREWLGPLSQDSLASVLRLLPVTSLLKNAYIKDRLNPDSSAKLMATELLYQVYQAYDWLHLYDKFDCRIQIGGSDQAANIYVGHDLVRDARGASVTGLTVPLLTTPDGEKYGKSAGNAVWLCPIKTSYNNFYQYFFRTTDTEVEKLLKLFTFLSVKQIEDLMVKHRQNSGSQLPQKKLADCVTLLVHGEHGLKVAQLSQDILYRGNPNGLLSLSGVELEELFTGAVTKLSFKPCMTVIAAAMAANCFKNERDGENIILKGGFKINQCRVQEPHSVLIREAHILPAGYSLFKVGKRNYTLVQWNM